MASRKPFYQEGVYFGRVTQQGLTTANTGTVQFVLRFKVVAYPDEENNNERAEISDKQQYERTIFMPLTEKTMEYQVENLQTIGFEGDDLALLDPGVEGHQNFVGREITVYCQHQPGYKDPSSMEEKWQISSGRREIVLKEVDPKAMRNLNSMFGKAKRAAGGSKTTDTRTPAPRRDNTPYAQTASRPTEDYSDQGITDEDIPF